MDLETVPLDDLLEEIRRRCPHGAVMLCLADSKTKANFMRTTWGNTAARIGLAASLLQVEMAYMFAEQKDALDVIDEKEKP